MAGPQPLPFLKNITAYQSSANKVEAEHDAIRLCYNESALGPSPHAMEAVKRALPYSHHYPDMGYARLRAALAGYYNLDDSRIICGAGSDDLIGLLVHAFVREGDEVLTSQYSFAMYAACARMVGAKPVLVPEDDLKVDLGAMLKAITPKTKMIFLANPNNPTGFTLSREAVQAFLRDVPPDIMFVYDAAYADYITDAAYSDGFEWVQEDGNVCVLRTFSKIHGLGGMRLGWAYGPRVAIDAMNRVRNPFNVSLPAEAAAIASLNDDAFLNQCREHTVLWREKLRAELESYRVKAYPSTGNFILARFASQEAAQAFFRHLSVHNILTRPMTGYGLPDCVRISVGTEAEMKALFAAFKTFDWHG